MRDPLAVQLATFASRSTYKQLPAAVQASAIERVLDSLGVSLGALSLPTSEAVVQLVRDRGGAAQATVIGHGDRLPAASVAFAGGVFAHSLDFDDTHLPSILHPSASVVPAALAAAEHYGSSGAQFLAAVAVGLEVCVRVGMAGYDKASHSNVYFDRGQHATSICGTLGAAVAAAVLAGLDEIGITHALGVSASMASGIIEANRGGGNVKRMHCGWAAQAGVTAAELVALGFTGPPTVLEGRFGLLQAFLGDRAHAGAVVAGLGQHWEVPGIFFKPYPANHFTHTIVDAAMELAGRGVKPVDVAAVTVGVPSEILRTVGEPLELKRRPETAYQAQFSGPYAVAVGLFGGHGIGATLDDYTDELARDPDRRELMSKVTVVADAACDAIYPLQFPATLRIDLADGTSVAAEVRANRGGPERPLTPAELETKFAGNAARVLDAAGVDAVVREVRALPDRADVAELIAATVTAHRP